MPTLIIGQDAWQAYFYASSGRKYKLHLISNRVSSVDGEEVVRRPVAFVEERDETISAVYVDGFKAVYTSLSDMQWNLDSVISLFESCDEN